jgi:hypothetical protein
MMLLIPSLWTSFPGAARNCGAAIVQCSDPFYLLSPSRIFVRRFAFVFSFPFPFSFTTFVFESQKRQHTFVLHHVPLSSPEQLRNDGDPPVLSVACAANTSGDEMRSLNPTRIMPVSPFCSRIKKKKKKKKI